MGSWRLVEYTIDQLSKDIDNGDITVPTYQRGAVWNLKQKRELIDSMNKGYPFGSILLYEGNNVRKIIDGLQRSTTIIQYVKNPADFFDEDNISEEYLDKIVDETGLQNSKEVIKDQMSSLIKKWVQDNHKNMSEVQRMQFYKCSEMLANNYPTLQNKKDIISELLQNMFKSFQDTCEQISTIKIPALVYSGDEDMLPEIFERINSQGAKLTKQQIYAATWASDVIKFKDNSKYSEILNINRDRYDNMLDESMELDKYDSSDFIKNREVNIFELVFGFGKYISKKYPYLFNYDPEDCTKVESVGFSLINACLLQRTSNMRKLNSNIKNIVGLESEEIEKFLTKIEECVSYVDKRLGATSKFKGNTRSNSKISPLHTEMQIVSIIATVFIQKHLSYVIDERENVDSVSISYDGNNSWRTMRDTFDKNIIKIYTMDIIGQKWKGSGDKKLDNIIINKQHYNKDISWEEFETSLNAYYSSMNSERNERKQVKNPIEPEKLILNIIYSNIFTAADQNNETNYDIEHLATKNLMKKKMSNYSEDLRLPISSIANLCLLPEFDNRTKQDKTLYDDEEYLKKVDINNIESKFSFTSKTDFDWLSANLSENEFKKSYFKFLDDRFIEMKKKIKESIF